MKTLGLCVLVFCMIAVRGLAQNPIIIDHRCTAHDMIPTTYLDAARASLRIGYGSSSHGTQLVSGWEVLRWIPGGKFSYTFSEPGLVPGVFLNFYWPNPAGGSDLGTSGSLTWRDATRTMLNLSNNDRNVVMWAWCGGVSSSTPSEIDVYLQAMDALEREYPSVRFVYMTGHLDGTGLTGALHTNNQRIRQFCHSNGKILFDFADIESYAPGSDVSYAAMRADDNCDYDSDGNGSLDQNWAQQWIAANAGSPLASLASSCGDCAHSQRLNCVLKGAAFWWLVARLAGWPGASGPTLNPPSPVSPVNNAVDQPMNLLLRWRSVTGATHYHVQVGSDSTFASGVLVNDSTLTDTLRSVSGLLNGQRYHWRLRSKNASGYSEYSGVWHFRTVPAAPGAPVLVRPNNGATEQLTTSLLFSWRRIPGATSYSLQLATDSSFSAGIAKNDTTILDTTYSISGLNQNTRYFWRVAGRNAGGSGPFSSVWSFRTLAPTPGLVTLVSPMHLATIGADSVRLRWSKPTPSASRYWLEVSVDSSFRGGGWVDSTLTDTTRLIRPLLNNNTYFWRVRGGTDTKWGAVSETRRFAVSVTAVPGDGGIPNDFVLEQNYPNPFNPSTEIRFGIPRESPVRLEIYSVIGQRIASVLDEIHAPGYYSVRFDGERLTSGMYLCRMTAQGVTKIRKMMLMK